MLALTIQINSPSLVGLVLLQLILHSRKIKQGTRWIGQDLLQYSHFLPEKSKHASKTDLAEMGKVTSVATKSKRLFFFSSRKWQRKERWNSCQWPHGKANPEIAVAVPCPHGKHNPARLAIQIKISASVDMGPNYCAVLLSSISHHQTSVEFLK